MGTGAPENLPDIEDLIRDYTPHGRIPVAVEEPIQVQPLGCVDGSFVNFPVPNSAKHLIKKDMRRQFLTILAKDDDIYIGGSQSEVDLATAAFWPKLLPLTLHWSGDLYVRAANTVTVLTIIQEQWTQ